jgi:hypothetical protein
MAWPFAVFDDEVSVAGGKRPRPSRGRLPSLVALGATGFVAPERARANLRLVLEGRPLVPYAAAMRAALEKLLPMLLDALWKSADPDEALNQFERFLAAIGPRAGLVEMLAADPEILLGLVRLCAGGDLLTQLLITQPELLRQLPVGYRGADLSNYTQLPDDLPKRVVGLAEGITAGATPIYDKVAAVQGVTVLNINDLANSLKPVVLPGQTMSVFVVKEGKERDQGVGYLDDGTMVVIEDGRKHIGKRIEVGVTSILQTSAGRMIFGKFRGEKPA